MVVMTHGPGVVTHRVPLTVSTRPLGSVTLNVPASTCVMTGVVAGQRLRAHAWTTICGLLSHGWWPLSQEYCWLQYRSQERIQRWPVLGGLINEYERAA
jgi:hypothetical protein